MSRCPRVRPLVAVGACLVVSGALVPLVAGAASAAPVNLVGNATFDDGTAGWYVTGDLSLASAPGHDGQAALVRNVGTSVRTVAINDAVNTVRATTAGAVYTATALLRSTTPDATLGLRLMEYGGSSLEGQAQQTLHVSDTDWHAVTVSYTAVKDGASIDLNPLRLDTDPQQGFLVDDVSLVAGSAAPGGSTTTPPRSVSPSPTRSGWTLTWSDEFDGTGVDTSKWRLRDGDRLSYDDATIQADNVVERDGYLTIRADKQAAGGRQYTTGYLDTIGKFSQREGRWEMRAKLPTDPAASKGIWPAFWLRASNGGKGEIDIMEAVGADTATRTSQTVHQNTDSPHGAHLGHNDVLPTGQTSDWHVYALEWEGDTLHWYIDDRLVYTVDSSRAPWLPSVLRQSYNIRLDTQVGGRWAGRPDGATGWPADYVIDYVRVYQR